MSYRLRTLLIVLAVGPMLLASCRPKITRNISSLIDDLSGVWTYSIETGRHDQRIPDSTSVFVVDGMSYTIYDYGHGQYSNSRHGEVVGQEGVYFFQNEASYYSPKFLVENSGLKLLIATRREYDRFIKTGQMNVTSLIRTADKLDFNRPPPRISIETTGLPYYDDYPERRNQKPAE